MTKLEITTAHDLVGDIPYSTFLLYGPNGGGKTRFASTFPLPYFFVPRLSTNELKTLAHTDTPVIIFEDIKDMADKFTMFAKAIRSGEIDDCVTVVVDNLTAIQFQAQQELEEQLGRPLQFQDWGKFTKLFTGMLKAFHELPCHVIWIAHSKMITTDGEAVGGFTLTGKSNQLFPNYADFILYCDVRDRGALGQEHFVNLVTKKLWVSRVRIDEERVSQLKGGKLPDKIPNHYDDLAELLGWQLCEEVESRVLGPADEEEDDAQDE